MEWAAVVNRQGEICATAAATDDAASSWPGSQAIAKAKAPFTHPLCANTWQNGKKIGDEAKASGY
jgi:hypothetical protein